MSRGRHPRSRWRWPLALRLAGLMLAGLLAAALLGAVLLRHSGYTPGEVLDNADRRLQGHPSWQRVLTPVLDALRRVGNEPSEGLRRTIPFVVPPPPPRFGSADEGYLGPPSLLHTRRTIQVGPTREVRSLKEAADLAQDDDLVEVDAGDYPDDVAVWLQKRLVIRAVGGNARITAEGRLAEGKAIWVLRNGLFDISGIDFVGARSPTDRNAAGIRIESGRVILRNSLFWGNDNGLLTGRYGDEGVRSVEIYGCEFGYNGHGDGQSHGAYVEAGEVFRVVGSYFHHGRVGHLIKSRSRATELHYNRITDEAGGRASYEVDLPNGGVAVLVGNILQQGPLTENSTLVAYGREGYRWPVNRLELVHNILVNDHPRGGSFLRAAPGSDAVRSVGNLLLGQGVLKVPADVLTAEDVHADRAWFVDPARHDYRWRDPSHPQALRWQAVATALYVHPRRIQRIKTGSVGAPLEQAN